MSGSTTPRGGASEKQAVESPCVRICVIDQASGLCEGCGRTLAEIAAWSNLSPDERRAIMLILPERLARRAAPPHLDRD